ncbi:transcriptional repressor [Pseudothauera nasutitermitis]|uniref:Transcriptional repressor n=1 Tax=Pseudothauera nasutitermitis TaxID=2565930 RepID=A0A4S4B3Q6_9RHOO|nr:Fur family transcriptional regulator [Pseudothauera nasutitermitis]THF67195.1 transcriptional repressor [Pseudothauera nasutitermitis]
MDHTKLTKQQTLVLDALLRANEPASAYELLERLRDEGFRAPPQIYRALDKLIGHGLVHKLDSLNAFVACAHPHEHEHGQAIFAICDHCGSVEEFSDRTVERGLKGCSTEHAFKMAKTTIEMHGTCKNCLSTQR